MIKKLHPCAFILFLISFTLVSLPSHSAQAKLTKVKLQLFWQHQFEFAGFYAAIEQGYFKKQGIDVELIEYDSAIDSIQLVTGGEVEFGLAGTDLIESYHQGKDVKLLASYFKRSPLTIITQTELSSLKQLSNKTIHGSERQLKQGSIRKMLDLYKVSPSSIKTVMIDDPIELFQNNKIAGLLSYRTDMPYELNEHNIPYNLYDPNQFGIASQDFNLFTSGTLAKESPELVKNFTRAANEGWQYAIKHPEKIIALIKSTYNSQNKTTGALRFEANETIKLILPELFPVGSIQKNKLTAISEELFVNKSIPTIRNLDEFIFPLEEEQRIAPELVSLLTAEEQSYLSAHNTIKVQSDGNYPPFNYIIDGQPNGYSIELINLMASMLGVNFEFIQGKSWSEYMTMLENKELDILINTIDMESRHDFARFTSPYAEIETFAVSRTDEFVPIISRGLLLSKRIAITEGYAINERLKKMLPQSIFIPVEDTLAALKLISSNQADVYFEVGAVLDYYLTKNIISNLQLVAVSSDLELTSQKFSIATQKDNKTLLSILQKTMNAIPDIEQIKLKRKWFGERKNIHTEGELFTPDELRFIKNISVTLCRPELSTDSTDLTIQLIDLINRDTGLNIIVGQPLTWVDSLSALQNKTCDLLASAAKTSQRTSSMAFTPGYLRDKAVLITEKEQPFIDDISDHLSQHFSILKEHSMINLLKQHYPEIKLIEVNSALEGLKLIEQGKVFGFISTQVYFNKLFKSYDLQQLKINTILREQFDDVQAIATRKEDVLLHNILTKSLANTDKNEIAKLMAKNIAYKNKHKVQFTADEQAMLQSREIIGCVSTESFSWTELVPFIAKTAEMKVVKSKKLSWDNALKALTLGVCDFLPEVSFTEKRQDIMSFTPIVHQEERVIITTDNREFISNLDNHLDKTFAVLKGDILIEQLSTYYPNIRLQHVDHALEGLQFVQNKKVFAYIGSISTTGNIISQYNLKNLKISGSLADKFNDRWTIATRKNDVLLSSVFSKIILSLDKSDIGKKLNGQFTVKYEQGFNYTLFWQFILIALFVLAIILLWNFRLSALNLQLQSAKLIAEESQQKVESQNKEILATQQQLIESSKMASLGTLTAGVAHEINNPTNFAYASLYMMKDEITTIKAFLKQLAGGDNADAEVLAAFDDKFTKLIQLTQTATEGTRRIKSIVENLRTFARLDDVKKSTALMSELLTSSVHLIRTQYDRIEIETQFTYDPEILCFPSKLNQVFLNIIVNACQAIVTKQESDNSFEGKIIISTSLQNNQLVLSFKDNGCGADKLTQQRICEPFFTTKDVGSGTGLGMAISFGIIEEHDGMLKITSVVDEGSIISVYLPVNDPATQPKNNKSKGI